MHSLFDACLMGQGNHVFVPSVSSAESVQTWASNIQHGAFGAGRAVMVGATGAIGAYHSSDFTSFTNVSLPTSSNYTDTQFDDTNALFLSVSYSTSKAAYASDPTSSPWSAAASYPLSGGSNRLANMGGITIAMQSGGSFTAYARSTDGGVTWASETFPDSRAISDVFPVGSAFMALASTGDVYTSTTGLTGSWTKNALVLAAGTWCGASNGTRAVVLRTGTNQFAYSDNLGVSFTTGTLPASGGFSRVRWTGEMFVAQDIGLGSNKFYYSQTGDSFSSHNLPSTNWGTALVVLSPIKVLLAGTNKSCVVTLGSYT